MTNQTHTIPQNTTKTWPVMMNAWNFWKLQKKYTQNVTGCKLLFQNLTGCKKVDSKSDKMINFYFKIMLLGKISSSGSWFLKLHVILKKCAFYGVNRIKTCFFVCNIFFQNLLFRINFFFKIVLFRKFFLQNHAFWKNIFLEKLTCRKIFTSKSDAL